MSCDSVGRNEKTMGADGWEEMQDGDGFKRARESLRRGESRITYHKVSKLMGFHKEHRGDASVTFLELA